jgi:HSP20 family protein
LDRPRRGYLTRVTSEEEISMVMRYDPFREVDRLTQQLANRLQESTGAMAMDAYRRGDALFVHFDLPGVDASSIEVTAEQSTVTVRADRRWEQEPDDQVLAQERPQGSFARQLMLGEHLDTEHIEASYEDGVLTLEIPVAPAAKPKKIEVKATGQHREAIDVGASAGNGESRSDERTE